MAYPKRETLLDLSGMTADNSKKYVRQIYKYIGQRLEIDRQGGEPFITDPNVRATRYDDWLLVQGAFLKAKKADEVDDAWVSLMEDWVGTHLPPSGRKGGNMPLFKSRQALLAAVRTYRNRFFKRKEELPTTIVFDKLGSDIEALLGELNLSDLKVQLENDGNWESFLRVLARRSLLYVLSDDEARKIVLGQSLEAIQKPFR
jgi:hypothetical protein